MGNVIAVYDKGESRGTSCYRLVSRNGQFIYLRTFGFLEIDDQGTVESFVCVNVLVSESVGMQLINDMKKKFSAIIAHTSIDSNMVINQLLDYNVKLIIYIFSVGSRY